ncbi:DUF4169 family protein [Mesorhizobium sp. SP-1A]|uniref:DUF4169 family protein n=1 Tax=Mesorhizobium sp. SP-1A TaxID=3077840 RepID=UPI0028F71970|nr:DUF4169 family protein [Mesorhizobium sp. SP-1A]
MAEIVNLRQARKQKARTEKERAAEQNRALHGRPKAERERQDLLRAQSERFVEGHRRDAAGSKAGPGSPEDGYPDGSPERE